MVFQECLTKMVKKFQASFKGGFWGSFKGVSGKFLMGFRSVSRGIYGNSKAFPSTFKGVS